MILKTFYVVRKREKVIQYEAGPFVTNLAAEDYIRQRINLKLLLTTSQIVATIDTY